MRADGSVAHRKHPLDWPVRHEATARPGDCPQRSLQADAIIGAATNFNVGQEAEERSAPIGSAPGVRMIESAITRLRQSVWHRACFVSPHLRSISIARLRTSDAFDVHRQAFREPYMLGANIRQRQMSHLVHEHPIIEELGLRHFAADSKADERSMRAEGRAMANAARVRG